MPKPPTSWKNWEAVVAKDFGGKRRGAYVSDGQSGKNDVVSEDGSSLDGWSIECKFGKQLSYQILLDACKQAEASAETELDIPIVAAKKNDRSIRNDDALVVIRYKTFKEFFVK